MSDVAVAFQRREPALDLLDREFRGEALEKLGSGVLRAVPWRVLSRALYEPLVEFLGRPGKEFRGELVTIAWQLGGRQDVPPPELPLVLEALHAGSLIVDDIEDESVERRGRPALHRIYGMPTALNAGNWLYFWPFDLLAQVPLTEVTRLEAHAMITKTLRECHVGQALDLSVRLPDLAKAEVLPVVSAVTELKTGSLVALAMGLGALASGAGPELVAALVRFGRELGSALQMLDDLSGLLNEHRAHKGREDLILGRPTWPFAWAAQSLTDAEYRELSEAAYRVLEGRAPEALLRRLSRLVSPEAKPRVRALLDTEFARISAEVPGRPALSALKRQIDRLERAYV